MVAHEPAAKKPCLIENRGDSHGATLNRDPCLSVYLHAMQYFVVQSFEHSGGDLFRDAREYGTDIEA